MADAISAIGNVVQPGGFATAGKYIVIVVGVLFFAAVLAVALYFFIKWLSNQRKYTHLVHIYRQEAGSATVIQHYDRGGIFTDPDSNIKAFWLMKNGVPLNPDNIPISFNQRGKMIVTLFQTGLKNFRYIDPSAHINPGLAFKVGEEDVNWAINSFNQWWSKFKKETFLEKYGHMMLWAITIVGSLMLFYFVAQKFDVISGAAQALNNAAEALKAANVGTILE